MTWHRWIFPYRAHLEEEVEYLRAAMSQKTRRLDEIENALVELARETRRREPVAPRIREVNSRPRGWDEYRVESKRQPANELDKIERES